MRTSAFIGLFKNILYRVFQEECARLRESVPYVKVYRYNPKHLSPKLNGYGDNGQRSLKLWQLLHTYWLPNTYSNWQQYVVSVMLISVLNMQLTYEWHKAILLNYINTRINAVVVLRVPGTLHGHAGTMLTAFQSRGHAQSTRNASAEKVKYVEPQEDRTFLFPLSPKQFNFGYRCFGLYRYTLT